MQRFHRGLSIRIYSTVQRFQADYEILYVLHEMLIVQVVTGPNLIILGKQHPQRGQQLVMHRFGKIPGRADTLNNNMVDGQSPPVLALVLYFFLYLCCHLCQSRVSTPLLLVSVYLEVRSIITVSVFEVPCPLNKPTPDEGVSGQKLQVWVIAEHYTVQFPVLSLHHEISTVSTVQHLAVHTLLHERHAQIITWCAVPRQCWLIALASKIGGIRFAFPTCNVQHGYFSTEHLTV